MGKPGVRPGFNFAAPLHQSHNQQNTTMPRGKPLTPKERDQKKLDEKSKKIDRELKAAIKQATRNVRWT